MKKGKWSFSTTPKKWKRIQATAGSLLAIVTALAALPTVVPGMNVPTWFSDYGWYAAAVLTAIIAYGQSREGKV